MKKPIFEAWCIFVTKLRIYEDRIELGHFFGLSEITIPKAKVNLVKIRAITNEVVVTTVGGEDVIFATWNTKLRKEIYIYLKSW